MLSWHTHARFKQYCLVHYAVIHNEIGQTSDSIGNLFATNEYIFLPEQTEWEEIHYRLHLQSQLLMSDKIAGRNLGDGYE